MAFGDWEFNGNGTRILQPSSAILGTSSLEMEIDSASTNQSQSGQVTAASGITRGIARGKIRTLIRYNNGALSAQYHAGIFCLCSNANGFGGGNSAYRLAINPSNGDLELQDFGTSNAIQTVFASYAQGYVQGTTIAIELEWNDDASGDIGGTHFIARSGVQTDYSDLTDRFQYVDAPGNQLTTGFEGIFMLHDTTATPSRVNWTFDDTVIFSIA